MKHARAATLVVTAMTASQCGGTPSAPTAPSSPTTGGSLPVVRAVTVTRTNIEAGEEIIVSASLDGTTMGRLRYVWSVQPNAGLMTPDGSAVRWRAPVDDPVPSTYVFSVTLVEASNPTLATSSGLTPSQNAAASSPPVTVNDARREMSAHSEAFLNESADAAVAPELCMRNFTESCSGRQDALQELSANRAAYSGVSVKYDLQLFVRSVEWQNCVAPDRSARCAVLLYNVAWNRTRRSDGIQEQVNGVEYVQGFYERNRWWLCGARFEPAGD